MPKPTQKALDEIVNAKVEEKAKQRAALDLRVEGKSFIEIGKIFEISDHRAKRWVDKARQEQRLLIGQGVVAERLVPKALAVYDQKLAAGDLEAARDILFGAGVLQKQGKLTLQTATDPLAQFREKYFSEGEVIDGEHATGDDARKTDLALRLGDGGTSESN